MHLRKLVLFTLTALLTSAFAVAQTQPAETTADKEKKKKEFEESVVKMLDQAIAEANGLRLAGNRAIVYALTGDLSWKFDEKRARELFRNSANEIVNNNADIDRQKLESPEMGEFDLFYDLRGQILPIVSRRDAELALELLVTTRPAKLAEAIAMGTTDNAMMTRVSQELMLEQQFAVLAADANPELAIRLIKDSLAKGVSISVLSLLQKLFIKDEKKANELGGDVIRRLGDADLARNINELNVAFSFLQFGTRTTPVDPKNKQFKFTDAQMRELALKVAAALLAPSNSSPQAQSILARAMPILEKLVPDRAQLLRQRQAANQKSAPPSSQPRLWDSNSSPEEILAMIPRITNENERNSAYQSLTGKIGQLDDDVRAKRLIDQIPDESARTRAREQFESMRLGRLASAGKLEEARRSIASFTERRRKIAYIIGLALQHYRRNKETDRENATSLMTEAKALVSDYPEDGEELTDLMEVVRGYATVEPETAFRLFEPVIEQINEHTQAMAVLSKYDKRSREFRKGEMVMRMPGNMGSSLLVLRYLPQMQMLGRVDLEKMSTLADRFARSDSRLIVRLHVVQAAMAAQPSATARPVAGN